jgi:hypothetical protein
MGKRLRSAQYQAGDGTRDRDVPHGTQADALVKKNHSSSEGKGDEHSSREPAAGPFFSPPNQRGNVFLFKKITGVEVGKVYPICRGLSIRMGKIRMIDVAREEGSEYSPVIFPLLLTE